MIAAALNPGFLRTCAARNARLAVCPSANAGQTRLEWFRAQEFRAKFAADGELGLFSRLTGFHLFALGKASGDPESLHRALRLVACAAKNGNLMFRSPSSPDS